MATPTADQSEHIHSQMRFLRFSLMTTLEVHLHGETTIPNIVKSIGAGVGSDYVLALQHIQQQAKGNQESLYSILPDEVVKAIETYSPRPTTVATR